MESLGLFGVAPIGRFDLGPDNYLEENDYHQIANKSDAAIVVTGELYYQGTDLEIRSKLYDASKQRPLPSPDVSGPAGDPSEVLENLSDRLKSAVLSTHDSRIEMWQKISPYIPKYEAWLEFKMGVELYLSNEFSLATTHFEQAVEIDPNYFLAHLLALWVHGGARNYSVMEQYGEKIEKFSNLSPGERYTVESYRAWEKGDRENHYKIWK